MRRSSGEPEVLRPGVEEAEEDRRGGEPAAETARDDTGLPGQLLYRVPEVMAILRLGRSTVYQLLRSGRLESVHEGSARRIPASAVLEYVELLKREASEGKAR